MYHITEGGRRWLQEHPETNVEPAPRSVAEEVENITLIRTLAHHPPLMEAWGPFGGYILRGSTLPDRDREMLERFEVRCIG